MELGEDKEKEERMKRRTELINQTFKYEAFFHFSGMSLKKNKKTNTCNTLYLCIRGCVDPVMVDSPLIAERY